jgi:predicted MFS family arabinose efflux permease
VLLLVLIAGMSFFYGPVDNLLAPAHLASNNREASTFGAIMAAGAVGLAAGLFLTQSMRTDRHGRALLLVGLAGIVGQLALLWWLPSDLTLVVVSFVTAALFAPLLPLLESSALKAVASTHRTLLLAAAATAASLADLAGTAVFGTLASAAGTGSALGVAAVLAGLGFLVALPMAKRVIPPRTYSNSTI